MAKLNTSRHLYFVKLLARSIRALFLISRKNLQFRVQETKEETEARLKKWEAFLNSGKENAESTEGENMVADRTSETDANAHDSDGTRSSAGSADETDDDEDKSSAK